MIPIGQEHHIGTRGLILIGLRYILPSIGFIIIAIILVIFQSSMANTIYETGLIMFPDNTLTAINFFDYIKLIIIACIILSGFAFVIGLVVASLIYRFYTFTLGEFDLKLRKGILYREEISIPYRHMQDINIMRGIFYQIFGVSRLVIDSAGHEEHVEHGHTDIKLEPIDKDLAIELRALLQHRIGVQVIENLHATHS
jgi:uncharacterized membrane protein YdbT with pleckstrin-like domain